MKVWMLAVAAIVLLSCGGSTAKPVDPGQVCADKLAMAMTSPFVVVKGTADCIRLASGIPVTDQGVAGFTMVPPIFDTLDKKCGLKDGTYSYLVHNQSDGHLGRIDIPIAAGKAVNIIKRSKETICP